MARPAPLDTIGGFLLGASGGFAPAALGGVASQTADAYGVGLAMVGVFTSALIVTHVLVQVPGGRLADRFGAARTGMAGLLVLALGGLLATIAADPVLLVAARLVMGVGTGMSFIAGTARVREAGGGAFAQGLYGGVALACAGLALVSVPQLYDAWGWRTPFWATTIVAAIGLVVVAAATSARLRPLPAARATPGVPAHGGEGKSVLTDPRLRRPAMLYSLSFGISFVAAAWTSELLERGAGIEAKLAAGIAALVLGLGIVSRPLGGWLLRTVPERARSVVRTSLVLGGIGTGALVIGDPPWLAAVGAVALGMGAGIPFAAVFTGAALTRPDAPAQAVGFVNAVANLVVLIATPLVGLSFALPGDGRVGFGVLVALWLLACAFVPSARGLGVEPDASGPRALEPA